MPSTSVKPVDVDSLPPHLLKTLTQAAALVSTEDFPAPPFPQWTQQLATQIETAVWAAARANLAGC
jgi:hypothetical protein